MAGYGTCRARAVWRSSARCGKWAFLAWCIAGVLEARADDGLTSATQINYLSQVDFPVGYRFQGWFIDGLSSLDWSPTSGAFVSARDNWMGSGGPGGDNFPPYFTLRPTFNDGQRAYGLAFTGVTALSHTMPSSPVLEGIESIRLDPRGDGLWLTSESPHALYHLAGDGVSRTQIKLPDTVTGRFDWRTTNYGLEGMTFTPNGQLWVAREDPLIGDANDMVRLSQIDPNSGVVRQFAYPLDRVKAVNNNGALIANPPGAGVGNNGVSEILALDDHALLVMERGWDGISAEKGDTRLSHNYIRVYRVQLDQGIDVSSIEHLTAGGPALSKVLMFDSTTLSSALSTWDSKIDNIEGMSFGPRLPDGHPTLVFVSDSNGRWQQRKTQFLITELYSPAPIVQLWDGGGRMADGAVSGGSGRWTANAETWTRAGGLLNDGWAGRQAQFGGVGGDVAVDASAGAVHVDALHFSSDGYRLHGDALETLSGRLSIEADAQVHALIDAPLVAPQVVRSGMGQLTLNNVVNAPTVALNEGDTRLDGRVSGDVALASGAHLSGRGTIGGSLWADGDVGGGGLALQVQGDLMLGSNARSTLSMTSPGTLAGNDHMTVGRNLTLGGQLRVDVPAAGFYRLYDFGGRVSGQFSATTIQSTDPHFQIVRQEVLTDAPGRVSLTVNGPGQSLQFWDGADAHGNGQVDGGAGAWTSSRTSWTGQPGRADVNGRWGGSVGVFLGGGGDVTVAGAQTFDTLQFSGAYRLAGGELRVDDAADHGTITVDAGEHAEIDSPVVATHGGLVKAGAGTLALRGENTYLGGTRLVGGVLDVPSDRTMGNVSGELSFLGGGLRASSSFDMQRALVMGADGAVDVVTDATVGLNGSLRGPGTLRKVGAGRLILSGGQKLDGPVEVSEGVLRLGAGQPSGSGRVAVLGGALETVLDRPEGQRLLSSAQTGVAVSPGWVITVAAPVRVDGGAGCYLKGGSGTLTMSGGGQLTSGLCVSDGTLALQSHLVASTVTVEARGVVRGTGQLTGHVDVRGRLAPGNSPGTLTVDGTVAMQAGSTFETDIDGYGKGTGKGNYSRLLVVGAGHQFIANGLLQPVLRGITGDASNAFTPVLGDNFRIVTAEGGIAGQFTALVPPDGLPANTRFLPLYNFGGSNSIDLRVVPKAYGDFLGAGIRRNTLALAGALDRAVSAQITGSGPAFTGVVNAIGALDADRIADTVRAMTGEVHADQAAAAHGLSLALNRDAFDHLGTDAANPATKAWASVTQDGERFGADNQGSGYHASTGHGTAGADIVANDNTVFGMALSHGESQINTSDGQATIRGNAGMLYAQQRVGRTLIDGVVSYGADDWSTHRKDPFGAGSLEARADGHDAMASLAVRLPMATTQGVRIEPYVGAVWQRVERDAVTEASMSPAALSLDRLSVAGTRGTAGITVGSEAADPLATELTWRMGAAAGFNVGKLLSPDVDVSLAGQSFQTRAPRPRRGFAQLTANGTMRLGDSTYLYGGLTGEQGSGRAAYGVTAGVRVSF